MFSIKKWVKGVPAKAGCFVLIAEQALKIAALERRNKNQSKALDEILSRLTGIGGPLNDNYHQYTKKQMVIFFEIKNCAEEGRYSWPIETDE